MRTNTKAWTPDFANSLKAKIDPAPQYQRGSVWTRNQKQLLIDSIFRGMDIPKIYLRRMGDDSPFEYEVVDGQQRLRTIWEYYEGAFPLGKDEEYRLEVEGQKLGGLRLEELPVDARLALSGYQLTVVEIEAKDEEVEEMFVRLQNGTTLRAAEVRNAMPGNMKHFVRELAEHPFFKSCQFSNKRRDFDHVAAQMTRLELAGEPTDVKNTQLALMYRQNEDFDSGSSKAKKVKRTLGLLGSAFPKKNGVLKKYNVVSLYMLLSDLDENFDLKGRLDEYRAWFEDFERRRGEDRELPDEDREGKLVAYQERTSHATDSVDSLTFRMNTLLESLHASIPDLAPKDPRRLFSESQRRVIWLRNDKRCQVRTECDGAECDWDNWHADHIVPHSRGGMTTTENGQVCCPACNLKKGASLS